MRKRFSLKNKKLQKRVLQYFQNCSFFSSSSSSQMRGNWIAESFQFGICKGKNNENLSSTRRILEHNFQSFSCRLFFGNSFSPHKKALWEERLINRLIMSTGCSRRSISHETLSIFYDRFDEGEEKGICLIVCFLYVYHQIRSVNGEFMRRLSPLIRLVTKSLKWNLHAAYVATAKEIFK